MICNNCGTQMSDNQRFCPSCGQFQNAASVQTNPTTYYAPMGMQPNHAAAEAKKNSLAGSILTWGILSLVFSDTFFLSLLGFIFSFKVSSLVNEYEQTFGPTTGRARVGKIFGTVGKILGLILTIFATLYFFALIMIAINA